MSFFFIFYDNLYLIFINFHHRDFIRICHIALQINGRCISADQANYQTALQENFQTLCDALSVLFGENVGPVDETINAHRNSLALFSSISGAPNNSSTA